MSIYYLISNLCNNSGCRTKLHKECATGAGLAPCKVSYDPTTAKEMLLMATSLEEQQFWTGRLLKKIQKGGYKAAGQVSHREIELRHWDLWAAGTGGRWDQFAELCPSRQSGQSWHSTENRGSWWNQPVEFHSSRQFWLTLHRWTVQSSENASLSLSTSGNGTISLKKYLQGDGTKISPQESMRSQYKPNIQVQILLAHIPHESSRSNHNFRQNLQHFQATRHFQESEDSLPNSSTIN